MKKYTNIGGQALIEGIMMRNKNKIAIVIRRGNGELVVKKETLPMPKGKIRKIPLLRGLFALVASMKIGIKAVKRHF